MGFSRLGRASSLCWARARVMYRRAPLSPPPCAKTARLLDLHRAGVVIPNERSEIPCRRQSRDSRRPSCLSVHLASAGPTATGGLFPRIEFRIMTEDPVLVERDAPR